MRYSVPRPVEEPSQAGEAGNVAPALVGRSGFGEVGRGMLSLGGTFGIDARKIREFALPGPKASLLPMHPDGPATHPKPDLRLMTALKHPSVLADVRYCDPSRGRDDVTVAVGRFGGPNRS